jgi:hypothetical protein
LNANANANANADPRARMMVFAAAGGLSDQNSDYELLSEMSINQSALHAVAVCVCVCARAHQSQQQLAHS